jgi:hypothetical protein
MPSQYVRRSADLGPGRSQKPAANTLRVDSDTDSLKWGSGSSGTSEKEAVDAAVAASTVAGGGFDGVVCKELTFVEEGAGTYTGEVALPAGAILIDIIVAAVALWDAATSASLEVGNSGDPDGYFTAVDLKATDLLANESISLSSKDGGVGGADAPATHIIDRYKATAETITATVVSSGAGTLGRTRVLVVYALPRTSTAATFVPE